MTQIGDVSVIASLDTTQYKKGAAEVQKANKDMEGSTDKTSSSMNKGFSTVAKVGTAALATAAVAVGALVAKSFGDAVKRVDTLNNSARTFENMGFTAESVNGAMKSLEKSIRGMPTPLDEAVRGMQMISASTNDIGKSQKIFTAMNNAIIGFGGSSADVTNAVLQMSQAFAGGRIDAQTWNSMLNSNLGPALNAIARQMGITTKQLKEGLSEGTISVETFQQALIDMNEKGGGGMKSFQQIAKDATSGIGTGWQNMQTAITRGVAEIIKSIGSEKISNALSNIGKAFEDSLGVVAKAVSFIGQNEAVLYALAAVVGVVLVAAFAALGAAIWTALAPMLPFAVALAAVAGVAYLIKSNWDKISPVIDTVKNAFMQFWDIIKPFRDFIGNQFKNAWEDLKAAFEDAKKSLEPFMPQIKQLAKIIGIGLLVPLGLVVAGFLAFVAVTTIVATVIARLVGWIAKGIAWFVDFSIAVGQAFQDAYNAVVNFGKSVWEAITGAFNAVVSWLQDALNAVVNFGKSVWNTVTEAFNAVASWLQEWGKTIVATMYWPIAILVGLWYKFKDQIIAAMQLLRDTVVAIFTPIADFISGKFNAAWDAIVAVWQVVGSWFRERWVEIQVAFGMVVEFFSNVFSMAYNTVISTWQSVGAWFRDRWGEITAAFSTVANFFGNVFSQAWERVKSAFSNVYGFFKGINDTIIGLFQGVGVAIGNAIGGTFKSVINGIIRGAVNYINQFISAINSVVGVINNIPGVKIGSISQLPVPQLAQGGIVTSPTLAMIGEGREAEAVIPLSKLDKMIGGRSDGVVNEYNINIGTIAKEVDADAVIRKLTYYQELEAKGITT